MVFLLCVDRLPFLVSATHFPSPHMPVCLLEDLKIQDNGTGVLRGGTQLNSSKWRGWLERGHLFPTAEPRISPCSPSNDPCSCILLHSYLCTPFPLPAATGQSLFILFIISLVSTTETSMQEALNS